MNLASHIESEFVVLSPGKKATIEPANASLYQRIDKTYNGFKGHELISCYEFESDWSNWEIHPNGDEVVVLLSGEVTFILKETQGEKSITLNEQGQFLIVPQGVWHSAKTNVKSKVLFITPGEGTVHKDNGEKA